jgi:hypothetical protein
MASAGKTEFKDEMFSKIRRLVPPLLEKFHKGWFEKRALAASREI